MKKIHAVVTDYIEDNLDWEAGELAKAGIGFAAHQLKFKPEGEVLAKVAGADVIVVNMVKFDAALIAKLDRCKLLIRHGIGYDNVDVAACTKQGIVFAYQPDYCVEDVAEHAIALVFACARKVVWSRKTLDDSSARGQWDFSELFPIRRMDGKTLGLVGLGRIGSAVARKLRSFGMKLLAHDPCLPAGRKPEVPLVSLEQLLKESDYVTLHTPVTPETRHLINAKTLSLMKPTAYLVNTARGPIVDAGALAAALKEGKLAGAAIDVFDIEPPPVSHPLFGAPNVILTPHIGWASEEAGWEIRKSILDDILAFAKGGTARCVVNKEVLKGAEEQRCRGGK
ncbi:MAG: C-terminal binding protein [Verrucomicrobiae bacterium]|nr:C-terminal binding protein [Verrucomicrobiae bacterium]